MDVTSPIIVSSLIALDAHLGRKPSRPAVKVFNFGQIHQRDPTLFPFIVSPATQAVSSKVRSLPKKSEIKTRRLRCEGVPGPTGLAPKNDATPYAALHRSYR
jgi:hypothetical protein